MTRKELEALEFITGTPELQSVLYDLDLMPEQLKKGSERWNCMLALALVWKTYIKDLTLANDAMVDALRLIIARARNILSFHVDIGMDGIITTAENALIQAGANSEGEQ